MAKATAADTIRMMVLVLDVSGGVKLPLESGSGQPRNGRYWAEKAVGGGNSDTNTACYRPLPPDTARFPSARFRKPHLLDEPGEPRLPPQAVVDRIHIEKDQYPAPFIEGLL